MDKYYWDQVFGGFQQVFQDTRARERAEDQLWHLAFIPGEVNTFIGRFEALAEEATYDLNNKATLSLFAAKLPFKMMDHIYKVTRPLNFHEWKNAVRQYHQDNTAVQNIWGINEETANKKGIFPQKKQNLTGFTPQQWAKILIIKMPILDINAMYTHANRSCNTNRGQKTRGWVMVAEAPNEDTQWKEGHCFTCIQGHISWNCPDKKGKSKALVKECTAATKDESDNDSITESDSQPMTLNQYIKLGKTLKEENKITLIRRVVIAQEGENGEEEDFWSRWPHWPGLTCYN